MCISKEQQGKTTYWDQYYKQLEEESMKVHIRKAAVQVKRIWALFTASSKTTKEKNCLINRETDD